MSLLEKYQQKVEEMGLQQDSLQLEAIQNLQKIIDKLQTEKLSKFRFFDKKMYPIIKGFYMWGGVGRGKTFIMDIFFDSIPSDKKSRLHFSHFMKNMHSLLKKYSGQKNPVTKAAEEIAKGSQIICFDEFFVEDIADAMILGNVFKELFSLGVVLVATSNIQPERLYANGLQRELFLPAIDVLVEHVKVLNLDSGVDYRFCKEGNYNNYYFPYNDANRSQFFDRFFIENNNATKDVDVTISDRNIHAKIVSDKSICFDMNVICGTGRSAYDYIELCQQYETIYLYHVQTMSSGDTPCEDDVARRFIALVDECYDQGIKLVILATNDFKSIYQGSRLKFEIQRTVSRLNDMQTQEFGK